MFIAYLYWLLPFYAHYPNALFSDSQEYYRATAAWVAGGDPWTATSDMGIRFAAPPPALLLNLPLLPFGEHAAALFWPLAGAIGAFAAIRHYRLPRWWILFPPLVESWLAGGPDPALLGLMIAGGGGIAALAKPYAVPGILGERRYAAIAMAGLLLLITMPLLPWTTFVGHLPEVGATLVSQAPSGSAMQGPVTFMLVAVATLSLGRRGLLVATPALWPYAQLHYATFSLAIARDSTILAIGLSLPGLAPLAVILHAVALRISAPCRRTQVVGTTDPA